MVLTLVCERSFSYGTSFLFRKLMDTFSSIGDILHHSLATRIDTTTLARIARDYLAVPGTSAPSKMLFFIARLLVADNHSSFSAESMQAVLYLIGHNQISGENKSLLTSQT
jgi:hypothetical protein